MKLEDQLSARDLATVQAHITRLAVEQSLREFYAIGVHDAFPTWGRERARQYVTRTLED